LQQKCVNENNFVYTMELLVVNLNTTASLTANRGAAARAVAAAGTDIVAVNP
jgi:allantoin racemase